jgi:hypothetical protein
MGMYADVRGVEVKFSGLIAKAIYGVKGPNAGDGFVSITRGDVAQVLCELDRVIKATGIISDDGQVSRSSCCNVANAARFAGLLTEWSVLNCSEEEITFV